MANQHKKAI